MVLIVANLLFLKAYGASALRPAPASKAAPQAQSAVYTCGDRVNSVSAISNAVLDVTDEYDPREHLKEEVTIFGSDNRITVEDNKQYNHPYSAIARFEASNGITCNASLIANRAMVLDSHCFYSDPGIWGGDRTIYGTVTFPNGQMRNVCLEFDGNSPKTRSSDMMTKKSNDLAVVRIIGADVPGVKHIEHSTSNAKDLERFFDLQNNQGIKEDGATMPQWVVSGRQAQFKEHVFNGKAESCRVLKALNSVVALHCCDMLPGQSGAPLIVYQWSAKDKKNIPVIYGLNTRENGARSRVDKCDDNTANELIALGPHSAKIQAAIAKINRTPRDARCTDPDDPSGRPAQASLDQSAPAQHTRQASSAPALTR